MLSAQPLPKLSAHCEDRARHEEARSVERGDIHVIERQGDPNSKGEVENERVIHTASDEMHHEHTLIAALTHLQGDNLTGHGGVKKWRSPR